MDANLFDQSHRSSLGCAALVFPKFNLAIAPSNSLTERGGLSGGALWRFCKTSRVVLPSDILRANCSGVLIGLCGDEDIVTHHEGGLLAKANLSKLARSKESSALTMICKGTSAVSLIDTSFNGHASHVCNLSERSHLERVAVQGDIA